MFEPFHEVVTNVSKIIQKYEAELDRPVIGVMPADTLCSCGAIICRLGRPMPIFSPNAARWRAP